MKKIYVFVLMCCCLLLQNCTNNKSNTEVAQQIQKNNNELIDFDKYLIFNQRPVIRPIYVETVKNQQANHDGYQIIISLKNTASKTSYKDVKILINYLNKSGETLDTEEIKLKKAINPDSSISITPKLAKYKNTSYKVNIASATGFISK